MNHDNGGAEFVQSGHDSSEDSKGAEFGLSRGIRTIKFQCPNILTYLMNVSCMVDMKKVYCPLYLVVNYGPPPLPLCTERHAMCRLKIPSVV